MELRDLHWFPCTAEVESPHNQQPLRYSDEGKVSGLENNSRHFIQYGIVELEIFFLADYIGDYQTQQRRIVVQNGQSDPSLLIDFFFSFRASMFVVYPTV